MSDLDARELELLRGLKKKDCEKRFYDFFLHFWPVVCKEMFVPNWHIKYLCDELQALAERVFKRLPCEWEYVVINVPPGSTKSLICSVMLPVWCWIKDDTLRFITGTHEKTLATDFNVQSRNVLKSRDFIDLWGDKITFRPDDDGKTSYSNLKGGSRKVASVGGSIVGRHAHIIIIDDPLDPNKISSEVEKKNAIAWLDGTLSMRKVDKDLTPTILIMQRLAEDDPAGHILSKYNDVLHLCLPGEITGLDNVKPKKLEKYYQNGIFDVNRLSRDTLDKSRIKLGSRGYSNQILQHPAAAEGTIWKREWWGFYDSFPETRQLRSFHSYDTDFGKNAATNGAVFAVEYENGVYITGIYEKSLEFPQLEQMVIDKYHNNPCTHCLIEDKASGQSLLQVLQQTSKVPVIPIKPMSDKVTRSYAATPLVENGKVYLPKNAPWVKKFIDMMAGFPDIKSKDVADAFSQLINYIIINPMGSFKGGTRRITADDILKKKSTTSKSGLFRTMSGRR